MEQRKANGAGSRTPGGAAPVAVVVVSWNAARFLPDCLDSLLALERPPAEIVVVDNASTDGAAALVRKDYGQARLIEAGDNLGFCRANNVGIAATRAPFVLVLNPDTRLDAAFLERLLPAFEAGDVGIACGKLLRFDGVTLDSCGQRLSRSRQPIDRGYGERDVGQFDRAEEVFGACGAAALYRREMLDHVADPGGQVFDEAFFAFYEDLDLAWRARRAGWRAVYRPDAVGRHHRGGSATERSRWRRFASMLGRSPEVRFHIVKNRYLAILRNDRVQDHLRDFPWIGARNVATLLLLACTAPSVLVRLWRERSLFGHALRRRELDAARPRHHVPTGRREAEPGGAVPVPLAGNAPPRERAPQ